MKYPINTTIFRVVGILMIIIGVLNIVPSLALFTSRGSIADETAVIGAEAETGRAGVINTIGAIPAPMGIMNFMHGPVLIVIGLALVLLKRWEIFAAIAIIIDIFVKIGTLLSQFAVERPLSEALLPLTIIVIEVIMTYIILQQWNARRRAERRGSAQTSEVKRAL